MTKERKIIEIIKHKLREAERDLPCETSLFASDFLMTVSMLEGNKGFFRDAWFDCQYNSNDSSSDEIETSEV